MRATDQVADIAEIESMTKTDFRDELTQTKNNHDSNGELSLDELENLMDLLQLKENRIQELENALRESVSIVTEREAVLQQEESRKKQIMDKVSKLEQRLLSLQSAQAMRCHSCKPLVSRLRKLEASWQQIISERRQHLQQVAEMKQEALEAAISEKDAHLALLEMSGIRSEKQASDVIKLKKDKKRLMERLRKENELIMDLLKNCETMEHIDELCNEDEVSGHN